MVERITPVLASNLNAETVTKAGCKAIYVGDETHIYVNGSATQHNRISNEPCPNGVVEFNFKNNRSKVIGCAKDRIQLNDTTTKEITKDAKSKKGKNTIWKIIGIFLLAVLLYWWWFGWDFWASYI
jgi:hypothetical protein